MSPPPISTGVSSTGDGESFSGQLSEDGKTILFYEHDFENGPSNYWTSNEIAVGIQAPPADSLNLGSLNGPYHVYWFASGFHGQYSGSQWGVNNEVWLEKEVITFNGTGGWSSTIDEYDLTRQLLDTPVDMDPDPVGVDQAYQNTYSTTHTTGTDTPSGTYTVSSAGVVELTETSPDPEVFSGQLSTGATAILFGEHEFSEGNYYGTNEIAVGMKAPAQGAEMTVADLKGKYQVVWFSHGFHGQYSGSQWGVNDETWVDKDVMTFDGAGNFKAKLNETEITRQLLDTPVDMGGGDMAYQNTYSTTHTTGTDSESGTYTVSSTGLVTITITGGDPEIFTGQLSADKQIMLFGAHEYNAGNYYGSNEIGVGIKLPPIGSAAGTNLLLLGD